MNKITDGAKKVSLSTKEIVTSISGVVTSSVAMVYSFKDIQDMQLQVDRANTQVKASIEGVERAQDALTSAIAKYGPESAEAKNAQDELTIANERLANSQERATQAQDNMGERMTMFALSIVPSAITMASSLSKVLGGTTIATHAQAAAQTILNLVMNANPILLVVTALAALAGGLWYLYNTCEPVKNAIDWLWGSIQGGIKWLSEIEIFGISIGDVFTALGNIIGNLGGWFNWLWGILSPIIDGVKWFIDNIWNAISGLGAWLSSAGAGAESAGAIVNEGAGGAGAITPGASAGTTVIVEGNIVNVEGSADQATAEAAAGLVMNKLGSVTVEETSSGAETSKIRGNSTFF